MTAASDDFNRTENPLASGWSQQSGMANPLRADGTTARAVAAGDNVSVWTSSSFGNDQWAEAVPGSANNDGGPWVRGSSSASQGYLLDCASITSAMYKYNGSFNIMGASFSMSITAGHTYRVQATGQATTSVEAFDNGVSQAVRTDSSSPHLSGQPGLHCSGTTITWDSWNAADIGGNDASSAGSGTGIATGSATVEIPASASGVATGIITGSSQTSVEFYSIGAAASVSEGASQTTAVFSATGTSAGDVSTGGEMFGYSAGSGAATGDAGGSTTATISGAGIAVVVAEGQGSAATSTNASGSGTSTGIATGLEPAKFIQGPDPGYDGSSPGVLSFGSDVTVGNTIVLGLQIGSTTASVLSISDTRGNTYELDLVQNQSVDGHQIRIYHVDGAREGPTTVTVLLDAAVTLRMVMGEYSRVGFLDQSASQESSSSTPSSGTTPSPTVDGEELVVGVTTSSSDVSFTSGSGYVKRATAGSRLSLEDKTVGAVGQFNADWSLSASTNWAAAVVTYRYSSPRGYASTTTTATMVGMGGEIPLSGEAFSAANTTNISLLWDSATDAVGYELGYDTNSGDPYANVVDVGNVLAYTLTGLASGTWYFAVRSYDSGGTRSAWGAEITGGISLQAQGVGASGFSADASAAVTTNGVAASISTASGDAVSAGASTSIAASLEYHSGEASSTGVATAVADNASTSTSSGASSSDGVSTATAEAISSATGDFSSAGTSDGVLSGSGPGIGEGIAASDASASGDMASAIVVESAGSADGISTVIGEGSSTITADALCSGSSLAIAKGAGPGALFTADGVKRSAQQIEDDEIELVMSYIIPFVLGQRGEPLNEPRTIM